MEEAQRIAQESLKKHGLEFVVLGLLGQAGSGKDAFADYLHNEKRFAKVAFADPMKRFVRNAFSISEAQLWGPSEERNRSFEVDDEWWFNAISSLPGSAQELLTHVLKPGDKVQGYLKLMDWLTELRQTYPTEISARVILQTLGTEWGRTVDPDMWVRYAHEVCEILKRGHFYSQVGGIRERNPGEVSVYAGVVIPDHRFFNEVAETQKHGYVLKLRRLSQEISESVGLAGHQSEAEQKGMQDDSFDLVLNIHEFHNLAGLYKEIDGIHERKAWTARKETGKPEVLDLRPS